MFWTRLEIQQWTIGFDFEGYIFTAHIGPLKVSYIRRGTQLYKDFQRTRANTR